MKNYANLEGDRVCKNEECEKKGEAQPIENFPSDGKGGYRWQCKACMCRINREWRARNKQHIKEYNKARRAVPDISED
jgi:hypothetical protein